jgi:hypothetical protein
VFPHRTVGDGGDVRLAGLTPSVRELGPGESHVDSLWLLDARTIFAGDVAYNGVHPTWRTGDGPEHRADPRRSPVSSLSTVEPGPTPDPPAVHRRGPGP